jgi:hypothetical protein
MVRFASFGEFCPFYLGEHRNRTCRRLHVPGSGAALPCLLAALPSGRWRRWAAAMDSPGWVISCSSTTVRPRSVIRRIHSPAPG